MSYIVLFKDFCQLLAEHRYIRIQGVFTLAQIIKWNSIENSQECSRFTNTTVAIYFSIFKELTVPLYCSRGIRVTCWRLKQAFPIKRKNQFNHWEFTRFNITYSQMSSSYKHLKCVITFGFSPIWENLSEFINMVSWNSYHIGVVL